MSKMAPIQVISGSDKTSMIAVVDGFLTHRQPGGPEGTKRLDRSIEPIVIDINDL